MDLAELNESGQFGKTLLKIGGQLTHTEPDHRPDLPEIISILTDRAI